MSGKPMLSEEIVEDSSDEESSDSTKDVTQNQNVDSKTHQNTSKSKKAQINGAEGSESDSDRSSRSSSSASTTSSGSKRKSLSPPRETAEPFAKRSKTSSGPVKRIETSMYAPPRGYTAIDPTNSQSRSVAQVAFADVKGKQIWHISAPANISLSQLRSLDLSSDMKGSTILNLNGTKYIMTTKPSDGATILIPNSEAEYISTEMKVSRSLFVQEQIENVKDHSKQNPDNTQITPSSPTESQQSNQTFFATQSGTPKSPRKQPDNLKARYIPFGVSPNHQNHHKSSENSMTNGQSHNIPSSPMSGVENGFNTTKERPETNVTVAKSAVESPESSRKKPPKKSKSKSIVNEEHTMTTQPETPSSTAKSVKKKHKRDLSEERSTKTSTPKKANVDQLLVSGGASSTLASTSKRKKTQ